MARFLWRLVTDGRATFPDGKVLEVSPSDWFDVVKFLYQHIDGPPKAEVDVTSGGEPLRGMTDAELIARAAEIVDATRSEPAAGAVSAEGL